jgi:hypothetical protein
MQTSTLIAFISATAALCAAAPGQTQPDTEQSQSIFQPRKQSFRGMFVPMPLRKNAELDFSVITEMTGDGRAITPPTKQNPAYYTEHIAGHQERGIPIGGEDAPDAESMKRWLQKSLEENGYLPIPTDESRAPDLILVWSWGSYDAIHANSIVFTGVGFSADNEIYDPTRNIDPSMEQFMPARVREVYTLTQTTIANVLGRAQLVGGQAFADKLRDALQARFAGDGGAACLALSQSNPKYGWLMQEALHPRYFVIASAYDYASAAREEKKLLWRTKISTNSDGVAMRASMITMVAGAAPYFGKDMQEPEIKLRRLWRKGRVEIGEAEVVEYITTGAQSKPAPARK